jgi:leader peptidase (prepilin peptidase) / N-methyltransferase
VRSCVRVAAVTSAGPSLLVVTVVVAALLGAAVGHLVNRLAGTFPWSGDGGRRTAVRLPFVELGTALLFALTAVRFGRDPELPAFLFLAGAGVLLGLIDARHKLLPNRVTLPSIGIGAGLLAVAALGAWEWTPLLRAVEAAAVLYVVFVVLVLISPRSIGMGDAKLAALLGLYLGWLGWEILLLGVAAGFLVQAVLAVLLLGTRRIGLKGELPFGPAMLLGAALVIGWSGALLG